MIQHLPCGARDVQVLLRSSAQPICNPVSDSGALAPFELDLARRGIVTAASSIPSPAAGHGRRCHEGRFRRDSDRVSALDPASKSRLLMGTAWRRPSCCRSRPTSQFATAPREVFGAAMLTPWAQASVLAAEFVHARVWGILSKLCLVQTPFAGAGPNDLGYR